MKRIFDLLGDPFTLFLATMWIMCGMMVSLIPEHIIWNNFIITLIVLSMLSIGNIVHYICRKQKEKAADENDN